MVVFEVAGLKQHVGNERSLFSLGRDIILFESLGDCCCSPLVVGAFSGAARAKCSRLWCNESEGLGRQGNYFGGHSVAFVRNRCCKGSKCASTSKEECLLENHGCGVCDKFKVRKCMMREDIK